jgi:uncharacterized protein (TIGR03437 family)
VRNHFIYFALVLGAVCQPARSQSINSVRVFSDFQTARFRVDGVIYVGSAAFFWPQGSKHFIEAVEPQDSGAEWGVRYEYRGWSNNLGDSATPETSSSKPITADASLKTIKVEFLKTYLLTVTASPICAPGELCAARGTIESPCGIVVNAMTTCYTAGGKFSAYPGPGAIFVGWTTAKDPVVNSRSTYIVGLQLTEPTTITGNFMPAANATASVSVQTEPAGLTVFVDQTRFKPPVTFEWGWDSVHAIGVDPVQIANSVSYAFESWSDGGAINHEVRVPVPATPINLVARFVLAHTVTFQTFPPNLKLNVDGRQDWTNYGFGWLPGSVHKVSAPLIQTDAQGRRYRFVSWSNGQPASFDYAAGQPTGDIRVIATYQLLGQATITSVPVGLPLEIDGARCTSPCTVERDAGESVTIAAPESLNTNEQSRVVFRGWTDGASSKRVIELAANSRIYTAAYAVQNRLSVVAAPSEGASIVLDPLSEDGFYDKGSLVTIAAKLTLGFRIRNWSGDLTGSGSVSVISLDTPRSAVLLLDRVPAIAPLGVRNAAHTAMRLIAPGSLLSIFGASLTSGLEIGPSNPLAQTLQGVTVSVNDTFLPLIFVSPQQINAQMASSIMPGTHTLTVRVQGRPETSAQIEIGRNAPGLFGMEGDGVSLGVLLRANGQVVTREMPAQPGETLVLLATGLGRYRQTPPDGFVAEESPAYAVTDQVELIAGGERLIPAYAGRAAMGVGIDVIRFKVPTNAIASGELLPIQVVVNGSESNIVSLPMKIGLSSGAVPAGAQQ